MEVQGKLFKKMELKQITDSFRKQEFVLEIVDGNYTQLVSFQMTNDNCDKLAAVNVGSEIKVLFNLRGRAWTNPEGVEKYFNSLDAWKIETTVGNAQATTPQQQGVAEVQTGGDLPF
jgi:single-strand DNA-binding protein